MARKPSVRPVEELKQQADAALELYQQAIDTASDPPTPEERHLITSLGEASLRAQMLYFEKRDSS